MGRRAKNKQGNPEPLQTQKSIGKRKADEISGHRPSKKAKESGPKSKRKQKQDSDSADGWEDVEDVDIESHSK